MSVSMLGILGRSLGRVEACAASSRVSRSFVTLQMLVTGLVALKADGFSLKFFQSHSVFPSCSIEQESKHSEWCVAERNLNFQAPWRGRSVEAVLQHRAVLPVSKTEMPTRVLLGTA